MEEGYWEDVVEVKPQKGSKNGSKKGEITGDSKGASLKRKRENEENRSNSSNKKQKKEDNIKVSHKKKEEVTVSKKKKEAAQIKVSTKSKPNKTGQSLSSSLSSTQKKKNINQTSSSKKESTNTMSSNKRKDVKKKEEKTTNKKSQCKKTNNDGKKEKKTPTKSSSPSSSSSDLETSSTTNTATTSSTASSTSSSTVQEIMQFKHAYEDPNWLGNEDEAGSVASGVLEEDYCFECGKSTLDCLGDNSVILCDICDGEYHINCVGLQKLPRSTYVCLRCLEEEERQKHLRYNVSDTFPIPKRKVIDRHVVYSPSRPLEMAWEECVKKGVMTVSKVLSYEIMKFLTHGVIENATSSGRVVEVWRGATVEITNRLQSTTCHNLVDREGRFDLKLPNFVVEYLKLNEILEPITTRLKTIMGSPTPQIRTHNVVFVPVGSKAQQWHTDDEMKKRKIHRYFTILIQLNSIDSHCGGTEIWMDKLDRGDLVRCRPGDALVFPGSLLHRGQANLGYTHRFFYYASFSCGADMNVGEK